MRSLPRLPLVAFLAALLAALLVPAPSRADTAVAADFYKKGMAAYALEDWDAAIGLFEKGFREEPKPEFLYNIAQAHRQAGRHEQAMRFYQRYLDLKPDATDRPEVERLIKVLRKAIWEKQKATAAPPVGLDGKPSTPADPGPLEPEPVTPAPRPPAEKKTDWVAVGLIAGGAAVVAVGVGLAVWGSSVAGQATDNSTKITLDERDSLHSKSTMLGAIGYSALGVGAAVAVGGVIKLVLGKKTETAVGVAPLPSGVTFAVGGTF